MSAMSTSTGVEVCFLVDGRNAVLWSDSSSSASALPDRRARWEAIWECRHELVEIAHSHPVGPLAFSAEDDTTMQAIDAALGRALTYSVITPSALLRKHPDGQVGVDHNEPWWAEVLRAASGMPAREYGE
jgi:hypothetical protein